MNILSNLFFIIFYYLLSPSCSSAPLSTVRSSVFRCPLSCRRRLMSLTLSCRRCCRVETGGATAHRLVRWRTKGRRLCSRNTLNSWFRWPRTNWTDSEPGPATLLLSVQRPKEDKINFKIRLSDNELLSFSWFHKHQY